MRPSLMTLIAVLALSAAPLAQAQEQALPRCAKSKLLDQVRLDQREAREVPPKAESETWMVTLHESPLAMDGYRIAARVEPALKQAWVRRSGGIAGWIEWLGPYAVEPDGLLGCPADSGPLSRLPASDRKAPAP